MVRTLPLIPFPVFREMNDEGAGMPRKPAISFIFLTLVLDILGFGLIVPILPTLVEELKGAGVSEGARVYGMLASVYALMQFLCGPLLGSLSDRFGRRRILLVSLLGAGLDYFLLAWAPTLPWFFVGRIISGVTGANYAAAMAYIADVSPPEKRAANFGLMGAAFGLGFVIGPALGGVLGEMHLRLPFWVAGGMTLVNWFYGLLVLPESLEPDKRRPFSWKRSNPVGAFLHLRGQPMVLGLAGTHFLTHLAHQVFPSIWVLYTGYRFHWGAAQVGWTLALVGVMAALVQGGLSRRVIPKWGEKRSAVVGMIVAALALICYGAASAGWFLYVIVVLGSLGGLAPPSVQSLASRAVTDREQGALQGILTSLSSVAGIAGPPLATAMFAWGIDPATSHHLPGAAFFLAAILQFLAVLLALYSFRVRRKRVGAVADGDGSRSV